MKLNINTHHAYLNTDIILSSEIPSVDVIDELTGMTYHLTDNTITLNLSAGTHKLVCDSLGEEVMVEIEDAIKLGGSLIKNAFVFDENPWVFVVTKDRLYATNVETKEEKIEFNITPDEIHAYSKYNGKTCDYFLFKTQKDYSIYNIVTGKTIISFTNHIYSNSHLVIFKEEDNVIVYDYRDQKPILKFNGQYSIANKLFFVKDDNLHGLNLNSNYINKIEAVGTVNSNCLLVKDYFLKLYSDRTYGKIYHLYSLGNGENTICKTIISSPYYIESFLNIKTREYTELLDAYNDTAEEQDLLIKKNFNLKVFCKGIAVDDIRKSWEEKKQTISIMGRIVSHPSERFVIPYKLKGNLEGSINLKEIVVEKSEYSKPIDSTAKKESITIEQGEKLLGCSLSENFYVSMIDNLITFHNRNANIHTPIFEDSFDTSSYNSAYFTSDGKSVVFVDANHNTSILGFDNMLKQPFDIEGSTVARFAGFNGYNPEVFIQMVDGRKPVWRDPISLRRISEDDMSNHIFMSADGRFTADTRKKTVYYNRLTKKEIDYKEYCNLMKEYDWTGDASDHEIKKKSILREQLQRRYGKNILFQHVHEENDRLIRLFNTGKLTESQIYDRIQDANRKDEEAYIKEKKDFTTLFIDILGYICYYEKGSNNENRILIGRSVWFLNYVSFSYDSRYLAFGAKMLSDTWRTSEEGVFVLYDLKEKKVVDRKDRDMGLHAVWMTMFNRNGDVSYYDSHANAMVAYAKDNYKTTEIAKGKSLLCFSPSGRYIALSDQNYICYRNHPNSDWGHQPSGNIFIHKTEDLQTCLEQYNDFGDGIGGVTNMTRRAGNVASAAFSSDEKRLLAVGADGVIVIRNLVAPLVNNEE